MLKQLWPECHVIWQTWGSKTHTCWLKGIQDWDIYTGEEKKKNIKKEASHIQMACTSCTLKPEVVGRRHVTVASENIPHPIPSKHGFGTIFCQGNKEFQPKHHALCLAVRFCACSISPKNKWYSPSPYTRPHLSHQLHRSVVNMHMYQS